jgi:hypothetical protein
MIPEGMVKFPVLFFAAATDQDGGCHQNKNQGI